MSSANPKNINKLLADSLEASSGGPSAEASRWEEEEVAQELYDGNR